MDLTACDGGTLTQDDHIQVGGKQIVQGLLDVRQVPGDHDLLFKVGGDIENEPVFLQGNRLCVGEPGGYGGFGHGLLHEGQDPLPNIGGGIHGLTPSLSVGKIAFIIIKLL